MEELERIEKAKKVLGDSFKEWSFVLDSLKIVETDKLPSAATDGFHLYYNKSFTKDLTDKQLTFLWAHEIFHVVGRHMQRTPNYVWDLPDIERKYILHKWNVARDHAIHQILKPLVEERADIFEWIPGSLYDVKYKDMASEAIYKSLEDPEKIKVCIHVLYKKGNRVLIDGEGNETPLGEFEPTDIDKELSEKIKNLRSQIKNEREYQQKSASLDGILTKKEIALETSPSTKDWKNELINLMLTQAKADYSYKRLHKGWYYQTGMLVPRLHSDLIKGVIAIDVSGSINPEQYKKFLTEIEAIRGQIPEHELTILFISHEITGIQEVKSGESINWETTGNGGTSFKPAFDYIERNQLDINFLIYFTDGMNNYRDRLDLVIPNYEVIWVLWTDPVYTCIPTNLGRRIIINT